MADASAHVHLKLMSTNPTMALSEAFILFYAFLASSVEWLEN